MAIKYLTSDIIKSLKSAVSTLINTKFPIDTNEILDSAVTAAKADVAGIMTSAGDNKQLFGLGGEAISIEGTDLNNLQNKTGLYSGWGLTNAPYSAHWNVIQIVRVGYKSQTAIDVYSNDIYNRTFHKANNVWSSWNRLLSSNYKINGNGIADNTIPVSKLNFNFTDLINSVTWNQAKTGTNKPSHINIYGKLAFITLRITTSMSNISSGAAPTIAYLPSGYKFKYYQLIPAISIISNKHLNAVCEDNTIKLYNTAGETFSTAGDYFMIDGVVLLE